MAEKEYIERNTALKIIDRYAKTVTGESSIAVAEAVRDIVDIICPAADVVSVVHCKNCEYNNECSVQDFGEMHQNYFCSHGKRKELDNG